MAKKIEISGNYTLVTDTVSSAVLYESPMSEVRYRRVGSSRLEIYMNSDVKRISNVLRSADDDFVDSGDTPIADIYEWLRTNTGASTTPPAVEITQQVTNYAALSAGTEAGQLAYVENSQGTKWLPGPLGGTYYPAGFYRWSGSAWVSDRNAIVEAIEYLVPITVADTGSSVALTHMGGRLCNMASANSNTTYTTSGTTAGAFAQILINASSEPAVTGGTKIAGSTFATSTNMYLFIWHNGNRVEYWFEEI